MRLSSKKIAQFVVVAVCFLLSAIPAYAADWKVARASKDVQVLAAGKNWVPFRKGMVLRAGSTVRTGKRGRVVFTRNRESIALGSGTVLTLPRAGNRGKTTAIHQLSGQATYEVQKRNVKHFSVDTPYLAAVVKGTKFTVSVGQSATQVQVRSGVVEVGDYDTGQFALVRQGQSAQTSHMRKKGLKLSGRNRGVIRKRAPVKSPAAVSVRSISKVLKQAAISSPPAAQTQQQTPTVSTAVKAEPKINNAPVWNATAGFNGLGKQDNAASSEERDTAEASNNVAATIVSAASNETVASDNGSDANSGKKDRSGKKDKKAKSDKGDKKGKKAKSGKKGKKAKSDKGDKKGKKAKSGKSGKKDKKAKSSKSSKKGKKAKSSKSGKKGKKAKSKKNSKKAKSGKRNKKGKNSKRSGKKNKGGKRKGGKRKKRK